MAAETLSRKIREKHRIAERLARLDAERERLSGRLDELEIAERVPARFGGKAVTTEKRRRARPGQRALGSGETEAVRKRPAFRSTTPV
jgi:hypothetical protein